VRNMAQTITTFGCGRRAAHQKAIDTHATGVRGLGFFDASIVENTSFRRAVLIAVTQNSSFLIAGGGRV